MTDHVLEISTQVEPAQTFTVDDEPFELLGFTHLDADTEAEVMGHLARFDGIAGRLALTNDDKEANKLAAQLRDRRHTLISKLTTLPAERVRQLPLPAQVELMRKIQENAGLSGGADS